jgi:uncharacterized protein (DUF433 family)
MIVTPTAMVVPLRTDADGVIRIGQSRVTLATLVGRYQVGDAPDDLHRGFPSVSLADIYAVIAYYLSHREEVEAYLQDIEQIGTEIRRQLEALPSHTPLTRDMLRARLNDKQN